MGRSLGQLDPAAGPVERFASELRALRALSGDLPFWKMARRCGASKSALAAAAGGSRLPSAKVTEEFVRACGGDWPWWRERWSQAVAESAALSGGVDATARAGGALLVIPRPAPPSLREQVPLLISKATRDLAVPAGPGHDGGSPARSRRATRWTALWVPVVLVVTVAVTVVVTEVVDRSPRSSAPAAAKPSIVPVSVIPDGTDPQPVGCFADQVVLETTPVLLQKDAHLRGRTLPAGTRVGTISLTYSARCAGAWARFYPTPGLNPDPDDTTVGATTIEADRPADNTEMLWRMGHIDSTYSGILLTGMGCVVARARIDMVGQNVAGVGETHCLPHRG